MSFHRRKKSIPSMAKIERYWWEEGSGGKPRLETELFNDYHHVRDLRIWSEDGAAKTCFACLMTEGQGSKPYLWYQRGHLHAESRGGTGELSNLIPLCARCNQTMPRFDSREYAAQWVESREPWPLYLARIDEVTPAHVPSTQVVGDAKCGIDWTPGAFADHYANREAVWASPGKAFRTASPIREMYEPIEGLSAEELRDRFQRIAFQAGSEWWTEL